MSELTYQQASELVSYDPASGAIRRFSGEIVGWRHSTSGYMQVRVGGRQYQAHRIAWLLMTRSWPAGEIDHINGARDDNRWVNLRDVSKRQNAENKHGSRADSRAGVLGVRQMRSGRWQARISDSSGPVHLGTHDTAEAAHAAYLTAKRLLHAGCTI